VYGTQTKSRSQRAAFYLQQAELCFMLLHMQRIVILLLIFFASGCSPFAPNGQLPPTQTVIAHEAQLLWVNPLSLPDAVRGLRITRSETGQSVCVILNQFFIWEPGDGAPGSNANTFLSVQRTLRIEVDGVAQNDLQIAQLLTAFFRRDSTGTVVGSHGGNISACFSAADLTAGLHLGHISFQSTSGKEFGYEWAFRVSGTASDIAIALPASLQVP
jgi:hypothetical protein